MTDFSINDELPDVTLQAAQAVPVYVVASPEYVTLHRGHSVFRLAYSEARIIATGLLDCGIGPDSDRYRVENARSSSTDDEVERRVADEMVDARRTIRALRSILVGLSAALFELSGLEE